MRVSPEADDIGGLAGQNREDLIHTTRRLLADLQALSSRISVIQEITLVINRRLSLDAIFHEVGRRAKWLLDFDYAGIALCQSDDALHIVSLFGPVGDEVVVDEILHSTKAWQTIEKKQPQLIADDPSPYPSQLILPLENEGDVLGVILFACQEAKAYRLDDMRVGMLLAMQLAIAIRNAHRFEEINRLYAQLEQTYEDLSRAERLRQEMTEMVVHDLRNPLSVILSAFDLMSRELPSDMTSSLYQELQNSAKSASMRMMNLIGDLLTISKLEAGELQLNRTPIDLNHLINEKKMVYQAMAAQEKKQVIVEDGDLPLVMADEALISRVLDNLIANAFKFTRANRGQIELGFCQNEQGLQFYVRDNGEGIAPEYHETIFERFKQVTDKNGMPLRQGTGLGLAFSRLVIEAHGGKIWLESAPDQGSTFYFTLPHSNELVG